MAKTIIVIGAGPATGLHVARRFGKEGFRAALVSRTKANLDKCLAKLGEEGIEAAGFPADVGDLGALTAAIAQAQDRFGIIDVLEYSPLPELNLLAPPRNITVENVRPHLAFTLGAIATVQAVLPGMLKQGNGGLLFTSAPSAIEPVPFSANFAISQSGIRSYVHSLHHDLKKDGIYAGMLMIAGLVDRGDGAPPHHPPPPPGQAEALPLISPASIAEVLWDMYTKRDRIDETVGDMAAHYRMIPAG